MKQLLDLIVGNFRAVLIAALGGYIALRNNRKNRSAAAAACFRASLLQAFVGLYPSPVNWPADIDTHLRRIFPNLQVAVAQFRPFVPWWRRHAFDNAWFRYRCSTGRKIDIQAYHHYMSFSVDTGGGYPTNPPDPRNTFHANVSKLLSFAKET